MLEHGEDRKLTVKEEIFAEKVGTGSTLAEAARAAGYRSPANAADFAKRFPVMKRIEELKAYYRALAQIEAEDIVGAQMELAFAPIEDALDDDGNFNFKKAKANGSTRLIKEINTRYDKEGNKNITVKFYSRAEALSQLAELLGIKKAPQKNSARARLLDAIEKIMRVENLNFTQAYEYVVKKQREGEVMLFSAELLEEVARERGIQSLGTIDESKIIDVEPSGT